MRGFKLYDPLKARGKCAEVAGGLQGVLWGSGVFEELLELRFLGRVVARWWEAKRDGLLGRMTSSRLYVVYICCYLR